MTTGPEDQVSSKRSDIYAQLRKLAEISKEIEQHARQQAAAVNFVQAGELKRRMDELTSRQDQLVLSIIDHHPDAQVRKDFRALARRIEEFRPQIRSCQDPEKLKELKSEIDSAVEEWVLSFQTIVSSLVGVDPPSEAINSENPL